MDSGSAPFKITRSARDPEESQLAREEQTNKPTMANPINLPVGIFTGQGVGEGAPLGLLGEGEGVAEICGVAVGVASGVVVGVASGVAVGLLASEAEADATGLGEVDAPGVDETAADGVALATGLAFLASLSRTPTRRSRLCFAVKKVRSSVTTKRVPPR